MFSKPGQRSSADCGQVDGEVSVSLEGKKAVRNTCSCTQPAEHRWIGCFPLQYPNSLLPWGSLVIKWRAGEDCVNSTSLKHFSKVSSEDDWELKMVWYVTGVARSQLFWLSLNIVNFKSGNTMQRNKRYMARPAKLLGVMYFSKQNKTVNKTRVPQKLWHSMVAKSEAGGRGKGWQWRLSLCHNCKQVQAQVWALLSSPARGNNLLKMFVFSFIKNKKKTKQQ